MRVCVYDYHNAASIKTLAPFGVCLHSMHATLYLIKSADLLERVSDDGKMFPRIFENLIKVFLEKRVPFESFGANGQFLL